MPAPAGEMGDFLSSIARDTKQRNCWPEPFVHSDQAAYRETVAVQVSAGWERQNLLSEFHFLAGGKELTEAGRMRVQWILNEVPEVHRQIYVHRADSTARNGRLACKPCSDLLPSRLMPPVFPCWNRCVPTRDGRQTVLTR